MFYHWLQHMRWAFSDMRNRRTARGAQRRRCSPRLAQHAERLEPRLLLAILVQGSDAPGDIVALAADDSSVYWLEQQPAYSSQPGAVRRIDKNGGSVVTLATISANRSPNDLVLDQNNVYILSNRGLSRIPKGATGGLDSDLVIQSNFGIVSGTGTRRGNNPTEMAIDPALTRIYVSNLDFQGFGSIQSQSKFGGQPTTIRQVNGAGPIATDRRSVYWFESQTGQILSAPLTGGAIHVEVSGLPTGFNGVRALRTDVDGGLYWGEGTGAVRKFVGGTVTTLATDYQGTNFYGYAAGFAVDAHQGNVYYATSNRVQYVPKTGGTPAVFRYFVFVARLAVDNDSVYIAWDSGGGIDKNAKPAGVPVPPNNAPSVQFPPGGAMLYAQNGQPIVISPGATVYQPNQSFNATQAAVSPNGASESLARALNFTNGSLTVSIPVNGSAGDVLEIAPDGSGPGQISISGGSVAHSGTVIGTFSGGSGNSPLVVSLNSTATDAAIQALIRRITFRTSGSPPSTAQRTVQFELTNSDAWTGTASQQVGVITVKGSAPQTQMYRAYNPNADYHFFTTSFVEFANAVNAGYRDESSGRSGFGVRSDLVSGTTAIHRMYNPNTGRHYYTLSDGERNFLVAAGWRYEKDEGFMNTEQAPGATEIFRLYNKNSGVHLYTENPGIKDAILQQFAGIWLQHTSLGFAFVIAAPGTAAATQSATAAAIAVPAPAAPAEDLSWEPVRLSFDAGDVDWLWDDVELGKQEGWNPGTGAPS